MFSGPISQKTVAEADKSFASIGLDDRLLAALGRVGFEHPTAIQVEAIPPVLAGRDLIGLAQTGSGKTAAFALPMLQKLAGERGPRGLVLSPTREIALQSKAFFETMGPSVGLTTACLIGGVAMGPQIDKLRRRPDVVIATPGRLLDHVGRGNLRLSAIEVLVLDEADHMLDLGFLPQINRVLEMLPPHRQTLMFSATMPPLIERLTSRFMREPVLVDLRPKGRTAEGIEHRLYLVGPDDKRSCLLALVEQEEGAMLVFVRRKIDAEWACKQIEAHGHPVERMHSDRSQSQRVDALTGLRQGEHRILVATDVAARGLDIPIIEHIVNFDIPDTVEDYVHRAGRTARGTSGGVVSTIATWQDKAMIREIEAALGCDLPRREAPGVPPYREIKAPKRIRRRLL